MSYIMRLSVAINGVMPFGDENASRTYRSGAIHRAINCRDEKRLVFEPIQRLTGMSHIMRLLVVMNDTPAESMTHASPGG